MIASMCLPMVQAEFLRHAELIKGFVFALMPDTDAAEDIFQDVFLVVSQKASDFEPGTDFLAWVRAIARNKVRQYASQHRRSELILDEETHEAVLSSAETFEQDWERHRKALEHCLSRLAPAARRIISFRYVDNLRPREIASRLGRSVNGVSVALAKVRRFLRDCVTAAAASEGWSS